MTAPPSGSSRPRVAVRRTRDPRGSARTLPTPGHPCDAAPREGVGGLPIDPDRFEDPLKKLHVDPPFELEPHFAHHPDRAEAERPVEVGARGVPVGDSREERMERPLARRPDQLFEEVAADPPAPIHLANVDGDLGGPVVGPAVGPRAQRGPSEHRPVALGHEHGKAAGVLGEPPTLGPNTPGGRVERRDGRANGLVVDGRDRARVAEFRRTDAPVPRVRRHVRRSRPTKPPRLINPRERRVEDRSFSGRAGGPSFGPP